MTIMNFLIVIMLPLSIILIVALIFHSNGLQYGPGKQEWSYVEVRPKTHLFWWLHYTTANVASYTERPWMIWLAGGPGSSSCGSGNILQSGPIDVNGNKRNHTYIKMANILYLDNPVGAGISYSEDLTTFVSNSSEATDDFMVFLREFLQTHPEFNKMPLYLYGDSYGGKLAVVYAERILQEINNENINVNLKGVGLAYPGIDLQGTYRKLGNYLNNWGIVDKQEQLQIDEKVEKIIEAHEDKDFLLLKTRALLFNKMLKDRYGLYSDRITDKDPEASNADLEKLQKLYDNKVNQILGGRIQFNSQKMHLNAALNDIFEPVINSVEYLLNNDRKVHVFNGQLDFYINIYGTSSWISNLNWTGTEGYTKATRDVLNVNGINEGYEKSYGPLAFYWLNRVGHRLPNDNPKVMNYILEKLLN